jgi:hypothetical protein
MWSTSVTQNDKTIEDLERDRRQDKEIDCRNAVDVVAQKRPPALGRWPRATAHVPSDGRLSDLEAKLEQFTMNVWRAPEWVRTAHFPNQPSELRRDFRSANAIARPPAPVRPKPGAVPTNNGLRPDNCQHL